MTDERQETRDKRHMYKTARATISCALFGAGDFVGVKYAGHCGCSDGVHWYDVTNYDGQTTAYPEHLLTDFCL